MLLISAFLSVLLSVFVAFFLYNVRIPAPIFGIYSQPGPTYWSKYFLMRFLIMLQRKRKAKSEETFNGNIFEMTLKQRGMKRSVESMERKNPLPKDMEWAGDCVFFNGSSSDGRTFFALGFAQRQNNIANIFVIIRLPTGETLANKELLTTTNLKTIPDEKIYKSENGIEIFCDTPMKKWNLRFKGAMVVASNFSQNLQKGGEDPEPEETFPQRQVEFNLIWEAKGDTFDFDSDISMDLIANTMALEPWSRSFFQKIGKKHQTHYEQFGELRGDVYVAHEHFPIDVISLRDHTIAPHRRWTELRRYIMLTFQLDDGRKINSTVVSMPETTFSQIAFGFVIDAAGHKSSIDQLDLHLPCIGESKEFPTRFQYDFRLEGEEKLHLVKVNVMERIKFKMGLELQCYAEEMMCEFEVDGAKGYGFCEAEYRISPY